MHIRRKRGWEIPESETTPEHLFLSRRTLLGAGAGLIGATAFPALSHAQRAADVPDPSAGLYPAKRNETFTLDRELTPEKVSSTVNNYYEFGTSKDVTPRRLPPEGAALDRQVRWPGGAAEGSGH